MADEGVYDDLPNDPRVLRQMVAELSRRQAVGDTHFSASDDYKRMLVDRYSAYALTNRFEAGQLVKWKPGLENKTSPDVFSVAVVIEHLDQPVPHSEVDAGSAYFREPLDLALGVIVGEARKFAIFWFDSRRFELADD